MNARLVYSLFSLVPFLFMLACTNGKSISVSPGLSSGAAAVRPSETTHDPSHDLTHESIDAKTLATPRACAPEDLAMFDRQDGAGIDLEHVTLPRGLYLATVSDMLLEKQNDSGIPTRILIREIPGLAKGGEVICNENLEGFGNDFQMSVTGIVKFDTTNNSQGADFTARQFYVFSDKNTQGIVLSHPTFSAPLELRKLIKGHNSVVHFVRLSDKSYLMTFTRRKAGGIRARLLVHLELVPR
jgi:hypothetical protein